MFFGENRSGLVAKDYHFADTLSSGNGNGCKRFAIGIPEPVCVHEAVTRLEREVVVAR